MRLVRLRLRVVRSNNHGKVHHWPLISTVRLPRCARSVMPEKSRCVHYQPAILERYNRVTTPSLERPPLPMFLCLPERLFYPLAVPPKYHAIPHCQQSLLRQRRLLLEKPTIQSLLGQHRVRPRQTEHSCQTTPLAWRP